MNHTSDNPHIRERSVSVVIPTYNRIESLRRVLPSYLSSPSVLEIIIVDDASRREIGKQLHELTTVEPRVRVLRNERNLGAPASRNRGASVALGTWVLQSEDDLALDIDYLAVLLEHAIEGGADIIAARRVWMRLGETEDEALQRANRCRGQPFNERLMDHNSHAVTSSDVELPLLDGTMLIRRELFGEICYHEPYGGASTWREESDFQVSALEKGCKLVFCPHAVTFHYSRASQSFGRNRVKGTAVYAYRVFHNNLLFLRRHRDYLENHLPKSLVLGSPFLTACLYGVYRTVWLIGAEALRIWRARRYGAFVWK
jgi:GT2 family glycosyltransferase